MRVLGIDPGSRITGYAVLEMKGSAYVLVSSGVVKPKATELVDRVTLIHQAVIELIVQHQPTAVAVEDVFYEKYVQSTIKLAYARAGVLIAACLHGLPVIDYSPMDVKKTLVGHGRATKDQVREMVRLLTGHTARMTADESDAVAIAICHAHHGNGLP